MRFYKKLATVSLILVCVCVCVFTPFSETTKLFGKFLPKKFWFAVSAIFSVRFIAGKDRKCFCIGQERFINLSVGLMFQSVIFYQKRNKLAIARQALFLIIGFKILMIHSTKHLICHAVVFIKII